METGYRDFTDLHPQKRTCDPSAQNQS